MYELSFYTTPSGRTPVREWLAGIRDARTRLAIHHRLVRVSAGQLGDHKSLGGGLAELRIHHGYGVRLYYTISGNTVVLLFCGGDKGTQDRDIRAARAYMAEWRSS